MKRTLLAIALILAGAGAANAQGYGSSYYRPHPPMVGHGYHGPRHFVPVRPMMMPRHFGFGHRYWRHHAPRRLWYRGW